ncbi:unnamed protein product [Ceratitis capitata]|uniref:(Mediterranean fruit fly) hypothetical protein n=1 Tax=Ceratitis capitata TaxID=7213 RepID=A0A811V7T9_CERCA|nr:unnamed protein product [Ceratitis capitata]
MCDKQLTHVYSIYILGVFQNQLKIKVNQNKSRKNNSVQNKSKMPHNSHSSHSRHGGSSSDDLGSTDEVKIFKDEGDREEEKISSENLLEEKSSLIDLTESEEKSGKLPTRPDLSSVFSKYPFNCIFKLFQLHVS